MPAISKLKIGEEARLGVAEMTEFLEPTTTYIAGERALGISRRAQEQ